MEEGQSDGELLFKFHLLQSINCGPIVQISAPIVQIQAREFLSQPMDYYLRKMLNITVFEIFRAFYEFLDSYYIWTTLMY